MSDVQILQGDCRELLRTLPDESVHCVVTSPPYWGLRNYRCDGQIGLESDPVAYIAEMVGVFTEVWRVLRVDGTAWVNLGDGFNAYNGGAGPNTGPISLTQSRERPHLPSDFGLQWKALKPKDLMMMPHRTAIALQEWGWWVRGDIVWHKPNPMPESVRDRPTRAHEYIFLLAKSGRYWYDAEAIREPLKPSSLDRIAQATLDSQTGGEKDYRTSGQNGNRSQRQALVNLRARADKQRGHGRRHVGFNDWWDSMTKEEQQANGANKRDVWTVATRPYRDAHFATYPLQLIEPCILAGCPVGGTVLDPFAGSGTTGAAALKHGRNAILMELNRDYCRLIEKRLSGVQVTLPLEESAS